MKPPSFNINEIERRRGRIVTQVLNNYVGQPISDLDVFTRELQRTLPNGISFDTLFESVRNLAGVSLTRQSAVRLAWRLSGNLKLLKAGTAVPPWTTQFCDEWVPLQILRIERTRNSYNKVGYNASCRVLAGTPATMKIQHFWNVKATSAIACKIGFSQPWGKYPFKGGYSMVGLRILGLIEARRSRSQPSFFQVSCPASMLKWNRDNVLKLRCRADGLRCPNNYRHECTKCAIGYDRCPAGTHFRTYRIGTCSRCATENSLFDPEDIMPDCVECMRKERMKKREAG